MSVHTHHPCHPITHSGCNLGCMKGWQCQPTAAPHGSPSSETVPKSGSVLPILHAPPPCMSQRDACFSGGPLAGGRRRTWPWQSPSLDRMQSSTQHPPYGTLHANSQVSALLPCQRIPPNQGAPHGMHRGLLSSQKGQVAADADPCNHAWCWATTKNV